MIRGKPVTLVICALGIAFAITGAIAQVFVMNVLSDISLPTPTCPDGPRVHFSPERLEACWAEREELYLPAGSRHLPRYLFYGVVASLGALTWIRLRHSDQAAVASRCIAWTLMAMVPWGMIWGTVFLPVPDIPELIPGPAPLVFPSPTPRP